MARDKVVEVANGMVPGESLYWIRCGPASKYGSDFRSDFYLKSILLVPNPISVEKSESGSEPSPPIGLEYYFKIGFNFSSFFYILLK